MNHCFACRDLTPTQRICYDCVVEERDTIRAENKVLLEACRGYKDDMGDLRAQLKLATDALECMGNCLGFCPNHLGADSYKDPGVKMAQEIIEAMRNQARQELKKIQEMGKSSQSDLSKKDSCI